MQYNILAQSLEEVLQDAKVLAVVIHTFNFDPRFFENYVMPVFVKNSEANFTDNIILNRAIWRSLQKNTDLPEISVYCDFYVKDHSVPPSLEYNVYGIQLNNKYKPSNFHPKHIFVLIEKDNQKQLVMFTGSGNMSPGGWCSNLECFSIETIKEQKARATQTSTDWLQDYLLNVNTLTKNKEDKALNLMVNALHKLDAAKALKRTPYYNSFQGRFTDFLKNNLPNKGKDIKKVEIISPFFSPSVIPIKALKEDLGISNIHILTPYLLSGEIGLTEEVYKKYSEEAVVWSRFKNKATKTEHERRNLHAKIYKFYTSSTVYTVIGSVNCTQAAWIGFDEANNSGNIEAAFMYRENCVRDFLTQDTSNHNKFVLEELDETETEDAEKRDAPEVIFTIDWAEKVLIIEPIKSLKAFQCINLREKPFDLAQKKEKLGIEDIKRLSKNAIISIQNKETGAKYHYYPFHLNTELRPLGYRITTNHLLQMWTFLDDEEKKQLSLQKAIENEFDEFGNRNEDKKKASSFLNELAVHFDRLVALENHIFSGSNESIIKKINYYLLSENVDTLVLYNDNLTDESKDFENTSPYTFQYVILNIVLKHFYKRAKKIFSNQKQDTVQKKKLKARTAAVIEKILAIESKTAMDDKQLNWLKDQI